MEGNLRQHGLAGKVCPPAEVVADAARVALKHRIRRDLAHEAGAMSDLDALAPRLAVEGVQATDPADLRAAIVAALADNPPRSWDAVTADIVMPRRHRRHRLGARPGAGGYAARDWHGSVTG